MRVACLVSGGKDSIYAAWVLGQRGWDVAAFVTLVPEAESPLLLHRPNASWVRLQAEAVGVPWRSEPVAADEPEEEAVARALRGVRADALATGALASEYQRVRFDRIAHGLGWPSFAPLWHHDATAHVHRIIRDGFDARFVHVAADGLDASWLGKPLDAAAADLLEATAHRTRLNVAGEGGEYETFVVDAPHFRSRIEWDKTERREGRDDATLAIQKARLVPKRVPSAPS